MIATSNSRSIHTASPAQVVVVQPVDLESAHPVPDLERRRQRAQRDEDLIAEQDGEPHLPHAQDQVEPDGPKRMRHPVEKQGREAGTNRPIVRLHDRTHCLEGRRNIDQGEDDRDHDQGRRDQIDDQVPKAAPPADLARGGWRRYRIHRHLGEHPGNPRAGISPFPSGSQAAEQEYGEPAIPG